MQNSLTEKLKQPMRWVRSWFWVLYNGYPARRVTVIGVTGTDGKTTTCWLVYEILKAAGMSVGMITTAGIKYVLNDQATSINDQGNSNLQITNTKEIQVENGLHVTNPDAKVVQGLLKKMADAGVKYVIIETTSHRLAQMKTVGYNTNIAVLTNLSREHLDYHKSMRNYAAAKAKLLRRAPFVILNADDEWSAYFKSQISNPKKQTIINFQKTKILNRDIGPSLAGEYNKYNIGAASAVASILKTQDSIINQVVKDFEGVPGRREEINNKLGIRMIVDFAHTPKALEELLKSYRSNMSDKSNLILVFGCTGERDKGKRPFMGEVANKYADKIIVTADDPRSEDLGEIYDQINPKSEIQNPKFIREDDRDAAIQRAVKMAKKGDVVVATGMGPEPTILIKGQEIARSDRAAFEKVSLV